MRSGRRGPGLRVDYSPHLLLPNVHAAAAEPFLGKKGLHPGCNSFFCSFKSVELTKGKQEKRDEEKKMTSF